MATPKLKRTGNSVIIYDNIIRYVPPVIYMRIIHLYVTVACTETRIVIKLDIAPVVWLKICMRLYFTIVRNLFIITYNMAYTGRTLKDFSPKLHL